MESSNPEIIRTLVSKRTDDYVLSLEVNDDETLCWLVFQPASASAAIDPDEVQVLLDRAGIPADCQDKQQIEVFCDDLKKGTPLKIIAAKEILPEAGPDGWLELTVSTSTDIAYYQTDERGNIDYRQRHAIANVTPGQELGKLHPPQNGPPGQTVTGKPTPPISGKPFGLVTGRGVRLAADGSTIIAQSRGRLLLEGKKLLVTDELVVKGNVNYAVGHVEFLGIVDIAGEVFDNFNIKATKGIKVGGTVGTCTLITGGNVTIDSMFGKGKGIIRCTGNLEAGLLNGVTVECHGNVTVKGEIRDSVIKALGKISVPTGIICGGTAIAFQGIEAKSIGAKCGTKTRIVVGINFLDQGLQRQLKDDLRKTEEAIAQSEESLENYSRLLETSQVESLKIRNDLLGKELRELKMKKALIEEELLFFQYEEDLRPNPKINVSGMVNEGVTLVFGELEEEIYSEIKGPASLVHTPGQGVTRLRLTPLSILEGDLARKGQEVK